MTNKFQVLGKDGEAAAASYLSSLEFVILETNYKTKTAELDIIAKDKDTLCFIEVKTRKSLKKGLAREAVTFSKQKKIIQGASLYLKENKLLNTRVRFDVVEVIVTNDKMDIYLIKHAFQAG